MRIDMNINGQHMESSFFHDCNCERHMPNRDPYVKETTRVAEIHDNFGQLRFKVTMTDAFGQNACAYQITVYSYCYIPAPVVILKEFKPHFSDACEFYNKCVEQYKHLAIAETRHFQDIKIYADEIGYHKIKPKCCKNCKWSIIVHDHRGDHCCDHHDNHCHDRHCHEKHHKYMCTNHEIFSSLPKENYVLLIEPIVDHDGICKYYECN